LKRAIFVDDEPNLLRGLRRMLLSIRRDWNMTFVESGGEALSRMDVEGPFDVVVTDLTMPEMNGIEFLTEVTKRYPQTVRFILSGQTDTASLLSASTVTHQFLTKPCDPQVLHDLLARAFSLTDSLQGSPIKRTLLEMGALPSMPVVHQEIVNEMQSASPSIVRIGGIIEKDAGLSMKLLQIVNAEFVGTGRQISSVAEAVQLLGLENMKSLVLMVEVFAPLQDQDIGGGISLDFLWHRSLTVGDYAMRIAEYETQNQAIAQESFTAALLHKVGMLILATKMTQEFVEVVARVRRGGTTLSEAERDRFGATHGEIGGFLFDLWGLPDAIVKAVTYYDYPSALPEQLYGGNNSSEFTSLTAVHVANYFCSDREGEGDILGGAYLDTDYLNRLGLAERLSRWFDLCV
jgi:HD-like signal output (HDOD) protein